MSSFFTLTAEQAFALIHAFYFSLFALLFLFFFSRTLSPRPFIRHPFLWSLPFCLIPFLCRLLTRADDRTGSYLSLFGSIFLACLLLYGDSFFRRLSVFLLYIILALTAESLIGILLYLGLFPPYAEEKLQPFAMFPENNPMGFVFFLLPIIAMQAAATFLFIPLWNKYIRHIDLHVLIGLSLFYVLIFTGALFIFPILLGKVGWLLMFIILFLSCLLFLYNLKKLRLLLLHLHFQKKEQALMKQTLQNFKIIQEKQLLLRKHNHDISNHLQAISYLLNRGKIEEAHLYIDTLMKKRKEIRSC